ncbi:MAG: amidohydrolase family protein [Acidobacteria bacterium]|nr:amidohydrolase family protein [Acidobacteriota bacterium]
MSASRTSPVWAAGLTLAIGLGGGPPAAAQSTTVAFTNARVIPVSGAEIERGTLVVRDGKVVAVGAAGQVQVPSGARVVDLTGKVVMPGLVDTHSHIGGGSGGDASAAMHPDVRIFDSFDARSSGLRRAVAGGITTVNVMPGSGHLMSGQTVYLKLRRGSTIDELTIPRADGQPLGGMKMANGTNSIRPPGGAFPATRSRSAAIVRTQFVKAQEYRERVQKAGGDPAKLPARDLGLEGLVEVLEGTRTVHFHTHRHDDILTALRLGREFGFTPVLQHVSEAWKVADEIAKSGAPASIIVIDSPGGKLEAMDVSIENGAALERAGALVGFHTDDLITDSRFFLRSAGLAVRYGMSREKALYGMTLAGARMLGLDSRIGSLDAGKDADFIVLSGDPLSVYTMIEQTWIEGAKVFDLADPADRVYAYGGVGASRGEYLHLHDEEDWR